MIRLISFNLELYVICFILKLFAKKNLSSNSHKFCFVTNCITNMILKTLKSIEITFNGLIRFSSKRFRRSYNRRHK